MKKALLILLLLCSQVLGAEVIHYVDPDATGAGNGNSESDAYTSLEVALSTEAKDIDASNEIYTFRCLSSAGTADTTPVVVTGWTTSATDYIHIVGTDLPSDGIYSNSAYRIEVTNGNAITISENYVRVSDIQIRVTKTLTNTVHGIRVDSITGASVIRVDGCVIEAIASGIGGTGGGIDVNDFDVTLHVWNCIIYNWTSGTSLFVGIHLDIVAHAYIYNCTVYNCRVGIGVDGFQAASIYNCIIGLSNPAGGSDIGGTPLVADYCCTNDGDGTNSRTPLNLDWDDELSDANNGDFTLVAGGNCIDNGSDDPGSGLYSDDIIGTSRTSTWSIGAYEGGSSGQVMIISKDFWGKFLQEGINGKWKFGKAA